MTHPLAEARREAGYTQEELAKLIGRDRQSIARIETGRQKPSLGTVQRIVKAFRAKGIELSADAFLEQDADEVEFPAPTG